MDTTFSPGLSPAVSSPAGNQVTIADWWFAGLDQRPFIVHTLPWTTRVLGVHLDGFNTWIQIEFVEDGSPLLLHLTGPARLQDAVDVIRAEMIERGM